MLNTIAVKPGKLTLKQILSVRCPMCGAKPKERCKASTGHPSVKTHLDRDLAAAKYARPESSGQAALRILQAITSRGLRILSQHK
ncbi:MAG: hypothetical protein WBQ09_09540 [Terriglobales bacterium]|jgi:hypothetical protein